MKGGDSIGVSQVSRQQLNDAVVLATTAHYDNITIDHFNQYSVFELEIPGQLLDFDSGKRSDRFGVSPESQEITAHLYSEAPDIYIDNGTIDLLPGPKPAEWVQCSMLMNLRCCGDTKCWAFENPENCLGDCPEMCWYDLIGTGTTRTSFGSGVCSNRTGECPMDDEECSAARATYMFASEVRMVAYGPGGSLDGCMGYLDTNRNARLDPGEQTNLTTYAGDLIFVNFHRVITDDPVVIPREGQPSSCKQTGSRHYLPTTLRRNNVSTDDYFTAGSISLLSTMHMKLMDRGMSDTEAHELVQNCLNDYFFLVDYADADPRGRSDTKGVKLFIAEFNLHVIVKMTASLLRSNGTLAGDHDMYDLVLDTVAQMHYDAWHQEVFYMGEQIRNCAYHKDEIPTLQAIVVGSLAQANAHSSGWPVPEAAGAVGVAAVNPEAPGGRRQLAELRCTPNQISDIDRCAAACVCNQTEIDSKFGACVYASRVQFLGLETLIGARAYLADMCPTGAEVKPALQFQPDVLLETARALYNVMRSLTTVTDGENAGRSVAQASASCYEGSDWLSFVHSQM